MKDISPEASPSTIQAGGGLSRISLGLESQAFRCGSTCIAILRPSASQLIVAEAYGLDSVSMESELRQKAVGW
jgi:hypothetical protein